jgi:hypothetical protein
MYSNWYLVGLPKASRRRVQCVQSVEKHQPFPIYSFDYGDLKYLVLHLKHNCKDRKAEIHPIAGTFKEQVMMKRRNTSQRIIRR